MRSYKHTKYPDSSHVPEPKEASEEEHSSKKAKEKKKKPVYQKTSNKKERVSKICVVFFHIFLSPFSFFRCCTSLHV